MNLIASRLRRLVKRFEDIVASHPLNYVQVCPGRKIQTPTDEFLYVNLIFIEIF